MGGGSQQTPTCHGGGVLRLEYSAQRNGLQLGSGPRHLEFPFLHLVCDQLRHRLARLELALALGIEGVEAAHLFLVMQALHVVLAKIEALGEV
eukprot:CAMPEP_0115859234 /NCGR_PEP_ID=MMETSP0287-20121206/16511_1 /TAXON_ID=412157 /ORGANISM="Chrysochromulina rotalis, Strain UIO044" /LENGTH=92 /DNA_ID=CAMNT_0003313529 /DNA_START=374 /DNA_END=652 /DNA_ORIENTATION=-